MSFVWPQESNDHPFKLYNDCVAMFSFCGDVFLLLEGFNSINL